MTTESQRLKGWAAALPLLNAAIETLDLPRETSSITPAKAAFDSTTILLTTIRDSMINKASYVELGLACAGACEVLGRWTNRRQVDQFSRPALRAIEKLSMTAVEIQRNIIKRGKRNPISRLFHRKNDHEAIATWSLALKGILHVLNTELEKNTHITAPDIHHDAPDTYPNGPKIHHNTPKSLEKRSNRKPAPHARAPEESLSPTSRTTHGTVSDIRRDIVTAGAIISEVHRDVVNTHTMVCNVLKNQEGAGSQDRSTQNSIRGELPPAPPRIFFGRDELIEKVVDLASRLTPIALIGAGGIGKTSIALTVLHDDRVKQRFGEDRCFIHCDGFPASLPHFLRRLSKAIGSGIENPEDLTPLRPFISSKDIFIVLDNAESILDPRGAGAQAIYAVVEELSKLNNICLCITSRITTVPPDCEWLDVPTLSMKAACDTFYRIYKHDEYSDVVTNILEQLDFHPLSITLLATVAHHNKWGTHRLAGEWEKHRTNMLRTEHNKSLAATIELSLSSLMFQELGPNARDLLGVVAFFPQGVDENNVDWLFPAIVGGKNIFDKFCVLSLTYRNDGFITMLAPVRDYLSPKEPIFPPLLCSTKERYFSRLSVDVVPDKPGFEEARWIVSEDANVEHLLGVFTTADATSGDVWSACAHFMKHLLLHKPRLTTLGSKIEALPDDHPSKPHCLYQLSRLFETAGNHAECKRLLTHALKLCQERKDDYRIARTLRHLSRVHLSMGFHEEGIQHAREASEISGQLGDTMEQARCSIELAWLLYYDKQLGAAEEAAFHVLDLLPEEGEQFQVCQCHHVLGEIYCSKGETGKAAHHFGIALRIASSFNWLNLLFWINFSMAVLLSNQGKSGDAQVHIEHAKSHAVNHHDTFLLARAMWLQARFWHGRRRFEEAKSEALRAVDVFEKLGALNDAEDVKELLRQIDGDARGEMGDRVTPGRSDDNGPKPKYGVPTCFEFLETLFPRMNPGIAWISPLFAAPQYPGKPSVVGSIFQAFLTVTGRHQFSN